MYTVTRQESSYATHNRSVQYVHHPKSSMPTQHKTSRCELTPAERAYLVGQHDAGESLGKISNQTGILKSTIQSIIKNTQKYNIIESLLYTGFYKANIRTKC
jgi:hypothetical protein